MVIFMFMKSFQAENGPEVIGPYSPGIKLGDFVYISGQLPINKEGNIDDSIELQTHACLNNLKEVLAAQNLELRHIVKTTVFMTDLNDFQKFNEIYSSYFSQPYPARSCVGVAALPKGAKVEIEALVIDTLVYEERMRNQSCGGCGNNQNNCEGCK